MTLIEVFRQRLTVVKTFILYKILGLETEESRLNDCYKNRIDAETEADCDKNEIETKPEVDSIFSYQPYDWN